MKRSITGNGSKAYDLLIVGGGVYGAAMAHYATLNGLEVALFEKDDFCSHTSANSQKVIHGGLRYLQSFDIKRVLESIKERQRFYAMFPHLVHPLPCVMPLYGWGMKSKEAMTAAFWVYRFLQKIPSSPGLWAHGNKIPRILSAKLTRAMFPTLKTDKLRGGALWYDGLCIEPERVVLGLLKSSASRGASLANYAKVIKVSRTDTETLSVTVRDEITAEETTVLTRKIALCTGPWFKENIGLGPLPRELADLSLISGTNIITEELAGSAASLALRPSSSDTPGLMFVLPWKKRSIAGTVWQEGGDRPSQTHADKETANSLCLDVHSRYPSTTSPPAIVKQHFGYVPGSRERDKAPVDRILPHYSLVNLEKSGSPSVLQVLGVKFTTVFDVSLKALGILFPHRVFDGGVTEETLPMGSPFGCSDTYQAELRKKFSTLVPETSLDMLYGLLGSELPYILEKYIGPMADVETKKVSHGDLLKGITRFFIEEEMVVSLVDLIHRRLFPGMAGLPEGDDVQVIGHEMASILGWSDKKLIAETEILFAATGGEPGV